MKRSVWVLAAVLATGLTNPVFAATEDECKSMWTSADADKDGVLKGAEADRYAAALRVVDKPIEGEISEAAFMDNCTANVFDAAAAEPGAPFSGANSFTENQAQDRVVAAGFTDVSELTKDENGIWRGTATHDGKKVNVAVDYKGNVVSQ